MDADCRIRLRCTAARPQVPRRFPSLPRGRDPPETAWFKRTTSKLYYRMFAFMSGVEIEPGSADFCLLDRQVVDEVLKFEEEGIFLRGLVHWVGYATTSVPFEAGQRHAGTSKYNLRKMLTLGWHGVSSFSLVPLRIGIAIGLLSSTFAFLSVGYAIVGWWIDDEIVPGWASSVVVSSFLFGVLFVFLAVLAEYVGRRVEAAQAAIPSARPRGPRSCASAPAKARAGRAPESGAACQISPAHSACARIRRLCEFRRELCGVLRVLSYIPLGQRAARRVANVVGGVWLLNSFVLNGFGRRAECRVAVPPEVRLRNAATSPSWYGCCSWTGRGSRRRRSLPLRSRSHGPHFGMSLGFAGPETLRSISSQATLRIAIP